MTAGEGEPPGDDGRRSRTRVLAVLAALVVVGAVVAGIVATSGDDDGDDTELSAQDERATTSTRRTTTTVRRTTSTTAGASTTVVTAQPADTIPNTAGATGRAARYGDDPALDRLWDRCAAGDMGACDQLWSRSERGTEYESFGDTCGRRNEPGRYCEDIYGSTRADTYGDDPRLDRLWDACAAGDFAACDRLYYESGIGTEYEHFGNTCGNRNEPMGLCAELYG